MERKFKQVLNKWKENSNKIPLMIIGARQVGKTYLIREFCEKEFENYIYINFDKNESFEEFFSESLDPEIIIPKIEGYLGKRIDIEKTVFFFDEIQKSERAINSLKYFCESEKSYQIICAGSLLGVKINRYNSSFPVGKVHIERMYPFDFEEFLMATDNDLLLSEIRRSFDNLIAMPTDLHNKALSLYKEYLCIGGMPAAINEFLAMNKDINNYLGFEKDNIIASYIADMTKYTTNFESIKIHQIYKSLPSQLGKENKKFMYKEISSNARSRDYEGALEWLSESEIVLKCNAINSPKIPLEAYKDNSNFKIYFNDVGLFLTHSKTPNDAVLNNIDMIYKGAIAENYVAQTLTVNKYDLYFYVKNQNLKIDFLIYKDNEIIPIEVKASDNSAKSLNKYMAVYKPKYGIKISQANFGYENNIKSIPLYAAFLI